MSKKCTCVRRLLLHPHPHDLHARNPSENEKLIHKLYARIQLYV